VHRASPGVGRGNFGGGLNLQPCSEDGPGGTPDNSC